MERKALKLKPHPFKKTMKTIITFNNFMLSTEAVFKGCKKPKRKPNYISKSGSIYWYGVNTKGYYVIRHSDHWVKIKKIGSNKIETQCKSIASCQWHLKNKPVSFSKLDKEKTGKAYLKDFKLLH